MIDITIHHQNSRLEIVQIYKDNLRIKKFRFQSNKETGLWHCPGTPGGKSITPKKLISMILRMGVTADDERVQQVLNFLAPSTQA